MFNVLLLLHLLIIGTPATQAQPPPGENPSDLITLSTGKFLRWYGYTGRTYFVQVSDTNSPLAKWNWVPVIEAGNNANISYEVDGTAPKAFFRLKPTDLPIPSGETLETADFDGDSISNLDEIKFYSTDPLNTDTDGDGLDDNYEVWHYGTDPANADSDNDGLSDAVEINLHGTNPNLADTDGDGMPDGFEITHLLNPLSAADAAGDLDSDGMPNGWEYLNGLNIGLNDANEDFDGDELNNFPEYQAGTKANRFDTDGDLLPDGWEVRYGLNPLEIAGVDGMDGDAEPDGVKNIDELIHGSSPIVADTDGDGTGDFQEIEQGSDPNDASDGGQPPPVEDIALVNLTVGDSSGSHSERYNMIVKGVEGDTRTIKHQATQFGVVSTKSYKLRKGAKYEVEIVHTGTDPDFLELYGFSNYDWKADIQPDGDALLIKKDPHTILTEVEDWPNSTFRIKGKKAELFVMKFKTLTEALIPSDWERKKLGVAELVNITVTPEGAGDITWTMADENDSELNTNTNYKPKFTAASTACDPKVKADFGDGISHTINFQVVEPTGESAEKENDLSLADMGITAQQQGVGMKLRITLLPDDVSFENLEVKELSGPASNLTGYFAQPNINSLGDTNHHADPNWQDVRPGSQYGDEASFSKWPKISVTGNLQWTVGSYEWNIPLRWRVLGKAERTLPNRLQKHEITGTDGTSSELRLEVAATPRTPTP